jgi:hypothetical protein
VKNLEKFISDHPVFGPILRHPLVMIPGFNRERDLKLALRSIESKKELISKAEANRKWSTVMLMHERPWRTWAFNRYQKQMEDREYWKTASWVWVDSENIFENREAWGRILTADRKWKSDFSDPKGWKKFISMPDEMRLFRGCIEGGEDGLSWTTDVEKARWFAQRCQGRVIDRITKKSEIFGCMENREESEVILRP